MKRAQTQFKLEKTIWTEKDFDKMIWHDNPIHAFTYSNNFEIIFDIDYTFEWILEGNKYKFWIAPCTLIFENVYDLVFDIGPTTPEMTIDFITKENPQIPKNSKYIKRETEFDWIIEMQEGTISFKSVGYKQYVRQSPQLLKTQILSNLERGYTSFDRKSF